MSRRAFRVVVTREDGQWLADVPELQGAHTYARSLPSLDQAVREVVVLAAGLPVAFDHFQVAGADQAGLPGNLEAFTAGSR